MLEVSVGPVSLGDGSLSLENIDGGRSRVPVLLPGSTYMRR